MVNFVNVTFKQQLARNEEDRPMSNGYIVNAHTDIESLGDITLREALHSTLDELLDRVGRDGGGAESNMRDRHAGRPDRWWRLTFCDFTGQELCEGCAGTGLKGSEREKGYESFEDLLSDVFGVKFRKADQ